MTDYHHTSVMINVILTLLREQIHIDLFTHQSILRLNHLIIAILNYFEDITLGLKF